jgi:flagellar biosynthesis chaperone FliJ
VAVSRALRRLLRVRELEEEQLQLALQTAEADVHRLEVALAATVERERRGRRLIEASARGGELHDRMVGIEEMRAADRYRAALKPRVEAARQLVALRRQEFMNKRIERRQAETLIKETEARDLIEAGRRGQQTLDDWYGSKLHRKDDAKAPAVPKDSEPE